MTRSQKLLAILLVAGCSAACHSTAPLGGTKWMITELTSPEPPEFVEATVEFLPDGKLIVTKVLQDGSIHVEDRERYRIEGKVITVRHPDYQFDVIYRFDGQKLKLHSERFIAILDPIKPGSESGTGGLGTVGGAD